MIFTPQILTLQRLDQNQFELFKKGLCSGLWKMKFEVSICIFLFDLKNQKINLNFRQKVILV